MKKIVTVLGAVVLLAFHMMGAVDAAFQLSGQVAILIAGDKVIAYDFQTGKMLENTTLSTGGLPGVTFTKIDAAINYGNGKVYFFSGSKYIRFDLASFKADAGYPKETGPNWNGLGNAPIDAAMNWPSKSYYFRGTDYLRFDPTQNVVDLGYPKKVSTQSWPGLPFTTIDAAVTLQGITYFFSGEQYACYDVKSDRMISGYPRSIQSFLSLEVSPPTANFEKPPVKDAEQKVNVNTQSASSVPAAGANWAQSLIKVQSLDVSPFKVGTPSKIIGNVYFTSSNGSAPYFMAWNERKENKERPYSWVGDIHITRLNEQLQKVGTDILIKDLVMMDILVHDPNYMILLAGEIRANTYLDDYPNLLHVMKVDFKGNVIWKTLVAGGNGQGPQQHWFDFNPGETLVKYNGEEYGVWFQVKKNWAESGKPDIHNGDKFVVLDQNGNLKPEREAFWRASHSVSQEIVVNQKGEFVTGTVGDAYPLGIQIRNQNTDHTQLIWPIEEASEKDRSNCRYTQCAGDLGAMLAVEDKIYCLISTSDQIPIDYASYQKTDLMLVTLNASGLVERRKWLTDTKYTCYDGKMIPYGDGFWIVWTEADTPSEDQSFYKYKNSVYVAVIDRNGDFIKPPVKVDVPYFSQHIIQYQNGDIGWAQPNDANPGLIDIIRIQGR